MLELIIGFIILVVVLNFAAAYVEVEVLPKREEKKIKRKVREAMNRERVDTWPYDKISTKVPQTKPNPSGSDLVDRVAGRFWSNHPPDVKPKIQKKDIEKDRLEAEIEQLKKRIEHLEKDRN